jgi:hypothetical protein
MQAGIFRMDVGPESDLKVTGAGAVPSLGTYEAVVSCLF